MSPLPRAAASAAVLLAAALLAVPASAADARARAEAASKAREWSAAAAAWAEVVAAAPADGRAWLGLGSARHQAGQLEGAASAYEKAWELGAGKPLAAYNLACLRARLGDADAAFLWLDRAVGFGFVKPEQMAADSDLAALRSDPRWAAATSAAESAAYPCRTGHAREFDFWLGEWDVADPSGTRVGESRIESILGGCVILENWTGRLGGTGRSFNLWDASHGRWQQTWVDDKGTLTEFHGGFEDGAMRFTSRSPDRDGQSRPRRLTFLPLPTGQVRQLSETTADAGSTWAVEYDFTYTKRTPAAGAK